MSNTAPYHQRARHPRRETSAPAERGRPQYIARTAWERMSPDQRADARARALTDTARTTTPQGTRARTAGNGSVARDERPEDTGLSAVDLAILRPLGRFAVVHDMAERLGLPTPARPHPTTTTIAEEARR